MPVSWDQVAKVLTVGGKALVKQQLKTICANRAKGKAAVPIFREHYSVMIGAEIYCMQLHSSDVHQK